MESNSWWAGSSQAGDDESTSIWGCNWLPRTGMMRPLCAKELNPPNKVSEFIDHISMSWKINVIQRFLFRWIARSFCRFHWVKGNKLTAGLGFMRAHTTAGDCRKHAYCFLQKSPATPAPRRGRRLVHLRLERVFPGRSDESESTVGSWCGKTAAAQIRYACGKVCAIFTSTKMP